MTTLAAPTPLPADIRLTNATAALLAAIAVVSMAMAAILWAAHRPVFAVRSIRVDGDLAHNNALTIRANAAPKLVGNFFTMDLSTARRAFESVPWVRQAVVRRVWPNRLRVRLEEHRPAALWSSTATGDEASDRLVNSFGEVFEANLGDVEDDALPTLRGPDGSSAQMLSMLGRLQPAFAPLEARIETLALSGRGSWRAELDTGAEDRARPRQRRRSDRAHEGLHRHAARGARTGMRSTRCCMPTCGTATAMRSGSRASRRRPSKPARQRRNRRE